MDPTLIPVFIVVFVGGGAGGFMLAWFLVGRQMTALTTRAATAEGKLAAAEQGDQRLRDAFASLSHDALLATPTTLIALLKAVALGWREARLAKDAHKIKDEGEKIYKALSTMAGCVTDLGKAMRRSVAEYNKLIGNMDSTLFLSAKRMRDLEVSSALLATPDTIEEPLRDFSRAELLPEPAGDDHLTPAYHNGGSPSA
ncbi:DNA recombination protein RmuC [Chloroflexales bacterium ZM16-3]|nr:DNA recombination protein RmuC [Chloroflexales bacterium ZM16-3]